MRDFFNHLYAKKAVIRATIIPNEAITRTTSNVRVAVGRSAATFQIPSWLVCAGDNRPAVVGGERKSRTQRDPRAWALLATIQATHAPQGHNFSSSSFSSETE